MEMFRTRIIFNRFVEVLLAAFCPLTLLGFFPSQLKWLTINMAYAILNAAQLLIFAALDIIRVFLSYRSELTLSSGLPSCRIYFCVSGLSSFISSKHAKFLAGESQIPDTVTRNATGIRLSSAAFTKQTPASCTMQWNEIILL